MNQIERLAREPKIEAALAMAGEQVEETLELAIKIQQIPSPTFDEAERARFVQQQMERLGLRDVFQDELHNVYGRLPSDSQEGTARLIISAHLDTVFPAGTDLTIQRKDGFVYGPGLGDNSTGLAGLLTLAALLQHHAISLPLEAWFVANVGEEGLGDLRGMRAVADRFGQDATYIVVEGGLYGHVVHQGIGVRRFRIGVCAEGGHSWGSFGNSSAIHELGHIIAAIDALDVPTQPKTTYNVGVIDGGTSINSIAQSASLLLDLRSEDETALGKIVSQVESIVQSVGEKPSVSVTMEVIGNRPAGLIPRDAPLAVWAEQALLFVGCPEVEFISSSTDANIPLSRGAPAICVGLAESGNTHRTDEYLDPARLADGLRQLLLLTLAAAGYRVGA